MQLKYLLLFCSSFLIKYVTSVESSIPSGISILSHTALQNEINTQPANPTKKRKRLPDLNKSPPESETEESTEMIAIKANIGPIGSSGKQIEKTRRKSKYEREREKIRRLPPNEREKVRIYEQGKAQKYRDKLKSQIGVTSRLCLRIKELKGLRKTGNSTFQQDLELDKIMNHKNKLRFVSCVELGTALEHAGGHSEQIAPIRSIIKRKKPIDLNEFPSTSDSSDEEEKRSKKKAKDDKLEPASKLTIKQIKELKARERYQKVRAKRMNLPAEELKKFRLRQNTYNRKYRQDLQNKINSVTTDNPSSTQTKQFDLVGYRKRKNNNQKKYIENMKKVTGFSDTRQAKLHEARRARQAGTLTQQQEQLLQNEDERKRRHYDKRKSAKLAAKSTIDQQ